MQMVSALTIEGKCEPMKRRLDQRGDWQKDDYDDQCRPQIGSEINGGGVIRTNLTINRDFCEAYPLRVYEGRNRGALRHHDDDNLQRGFL